MIKKIAILGIIALFTFLLIYCTTDESTIIGPFGDASKYITVANFSADKTLLYSNGDTSIVNIKVLDIDKSPAIGLKIDFTAQFGNITESDTTDSSGIAFATFVSSDSAGVNIVTADFGIKTDSLEIRIIHYQPKYVDLFSESLTLVADGISYTTITAVFKDSLGSPMPGLLVTFNTTLGTLYPVHVQTDDNGVAITTLTSVAEEGIATVTATSFVTNEIEVEFKNYVPVYVDIDSEIRTLLADGMSEASIVAKAYDSANEFIPGAVFNFSSTVGSLNKTTNVRANQDGEAEVTLTSEGSSIDTTAIVKAVVVADTSISEDVDIKLLGITSITNIDSTKMSNGGVYKAYIRTNLFETFSGLNLSSGVVSFSSPTGIMNDPLVAINELGAAYSIFETNVFPTSQNDIIITGKLSSSSVISSESEEFDIPGVEMLVNTVDDEVMGDGEGWVLVKATLRETTGEAITNMEIDWETEAGTIIGQSTTNTNGHTIDTLRIEAAVSGNINNAVIAKYGEYVSASDIITFVSPINSNRLILGFEPDTTGHGIIPCNIDTAIAVREVGISAQFVNSNGIGYGGQLINFSVVPNNFASICPTDTTSVDTTGGGISGLANVMMVYPPQSGGEIVRVWAEHLDGTRGSIDVILPKDIAAVD